MELTTDRLFLREMTPEDFDALYAVLADSDIMQHYPYTYDEARVRNWIGKNMERYRVFGFGLWAVCLKATGEMIGDCGLTMQNINGAIMPEIGYHIAGVSAKWLRKGSGAGCPGLDVCAYSVRYGVLLHEKRKYPVLSHGGSKRNEDA